MQKIRILVKIALICVIVATIALTIASLTLPGNETLLNIIQFSSFVILALMAFLLYEKMKAVSIATFILIAFMTTLFVIDKL